MRKFALWVRHYSYRSSTPLKLVFTTDGWMIWTYDIQRISSVLSPNSYHFDITSPIATIQMLWDITCKIDTLYANVECLSYLTDYCRWVPSWWDCRWELEQSHWVLNPWGGCRQDWWHAVHSYWPRCQLVLCLVPSHVIHMNISLEVRVVRMYWSNHAQTYIMACVSLYTSLYELIYVQP